MSELKNILESYRQAVADNKKAALATIVKVEGSSYRQAGARMLVTEDGRITGAISGGCLEGDALRKAMLCIHQKKNKLITYDTSDENDVEFGVQLGCNGIVHVLFEFIDEQNSGNPIRLLSEIPAQRRESVTITLFSLTNRDEQLGTVVFSDGVKFLGRQGVDNKNLVSTALTDKRSSIHELGSGVSALVAFHPIPVSLIVAGAGNDVIPLVKMADLLGWETTVADGRIHYAKTERFPEAGCVWLGNPQSVIDNITIDNQTYFVLMAHNYQYELELLKLVVRFNELPYIGILGPKSKREKLVADLEISGFDPDSFSAKLFGPVGLDIGAETSEEIAVSVVSEIKSVISGRSGGSLRIRSERIHTETQTTKIA